MNITQEGRRQAWLKSLDPAARNAVMTAIRAAEPTERYEPFDSTEELLQWYNRVVVPVVDAEMAKV